MDPEPLQYIELNPPAPASATIIWLHGLGADGHDLQPIAEQLGHIVPLPLRHILPHAPIRAVTVNNHQRMRAWYDIADFDMSHPDDAPGIAAAEQAVGRLIEKETAAGMSTRCIVLAGFSQGGAIALRLALQRPLLGIVGFSAYLPHAGSIQNITPGPARKASILMGHGDSDPVIPVEYGEQSRDILCTLGFRVEWHVYPMGHTVCPQEINDMGLWLLDILC